MTGAPGALGRPLTPADLAALERIVDALPETLREAVGRLPSYQRVAFRWLARELDLLGPAPGESLSARELGAELERGRALRVAQVERERLERSIAGSSASAAQKAMLAQHVAHLWHVLAEALGRPPAAASGP